jgi:DNA-binding IclR family transcriptional regulator
VPAAERAQEHLRYSVSVDRGFAILECFSSARASEGIADVATSVDLPRSSVHRYLQTLSALGLVEQRGTPSRRYRLTALAADVGSAAIAATGLRALAHQELIALRRSSGCTARLAIRLGLDALLVDQAISLAPGQGMLALDVRPGARLSDSDCALRQALLSKLDLSELPSELRRKGRTARAALEQVRERGVAMQDGTGGAGFCAMAVPIALSGSDQAIAAIDLIGNPPQVTLEMLQAHLEALSAVAQRLAPAIAQLPWAQWRPYSRPEDR